MPVPVRRSMHTPRGTNSRRTSASPVVSPPVSRPVSAPRVPRRRSLHEQGSAPRLSVSRPKVPRGRSSSSSSSASLPPTKRAAVARRVAVRAPSTSSSSSASTSSSSSPSSSANTKDTVERSAPRPAPFGVAPAASASSSAHPPPFFSPPPRVRVWRVDSEDLSHVASQLKTPAPPSRFKSMLKKVVPFSGVFSYLFDTSQRASDGSDSELPAAYRPPLAADTPSQSGWGLWSWIFGSSQERDGEAAEHIDATPEKLRNFRSAVAVLTKSIETTTGNISALERDLEQKKAALRAVPAGRSQTVQTRRAYLLRVINRLETRINDAEASLARLEAMRAASRRAIDNFEYMQLIQHSSATLAESASSSGQIIDLADDIRDLVGDVCTADDLLSMPLEAV